MNNKATPAYLAICLLFTMSVLLVAGCSRQKITERKPVRLGLTVWAGTAHAFIAKEKGIFKKNNVEIELLLEKDDPAMLNSYRNKKLDAMLTVVSDVAILTAEGHPVKIVYIADYSDNGDMIVGRPQFKSLSDLKGKTVSFQGINSFSHIYVLAALEKAGLKEAELKFKDIDGSEVLNSLEKGEIDAGHTWDPTLTQALKKGYKALSKAGDMPGIITDILAFSDKMIKERPDEVMKIIESLLEARAFVYTNREEALSIMSKAEGMTLEEITSGINGVHLLSLEDNLKAMQKDAPASLYQSVVKMAEFHMNRGQLSKLPNADDIIEPGFIIKLNREKK